MCRLKSGLGFYSNLAPLLLVLKACQGQSQATDIRGAIKSFYVLGMSELQPQGRALFLSDTWMFSGMKETRL